MIDKTSYKDHVSTITDDGKGRKWMYPKLIKGKLYLLRNIFAGALLTLLFAGPFIKVNGEQLL